MTLIIFQGHTDDRKMEVKVVFQTCEDNVLNNLGIYLKENQRHGLCFSEIFDVFYLMWDAL